MKSSLSSSIMCSCSKARRCNDFWPRGVPASYSDGQNRTMIRRLRRYWLLCHRWLGLSVGLLFVLLGLTGSFLVFHRAIDEWLNPSILLAENRGFRKSLDEIVATARYACADLRTDPLFIDLPSSDSGVWTVWFQTGPTHAHVMTQVYVAPCSGEVTGRRIWGRYLTTWVYQLHHRLLAGKLGETLVGLSGICLGLSLFTGLVLWWPLWRHSWRAGIAIRRGALFNYDVHKTLGVVSGLLLAMLAFTGVYMIFPEWIKPCIHIVSAESAPDAAMLRSKPVEGSTPVGPAQALSAAQGVFKDGEVKRLYMPVGSEGAYVARIRREGDVRTTSGNSRVWIDQYSGKVLAVRDWNTRTAADTIVAWQFPLHNGEALGLPGRLLVFTAGLCPGVLYVTGLLMWQRKQRSRQRQLHRARIRKGI